MKEDGNTVTIEMMQRTLSGGEQLLSDIEELRERPDTFKWCYHCEDHILRRHWLDHREHSREARPDPNGNASSSDDEEEVKELGGMYEITLSYSVDYRFRIPAWSEHDAEERAKDLQLDARPADSHHVHTRKRQVKTIMSDDPKLPDSFDPHGMTPLWEAWGKEDDS